MNFISKSTCLALSLLVAMPAAFGSGNEPKTPLKGGDKGSAAASNSTGWFTGWFGRGSQEAGLGAASAAAGINYFWPLIAGGSAVAGVAAYKYVPAVKQKVDAGVKFTKEKAEALSKAINAKLVSLDKPFSQADAIKLLGGSALVYYFGNSTLEAVKSAGSSVRATSAELSGKVTENQYVKEYVLKNNWTKVGAVAVTVAVPVLVYKAYKAYKARQKTAPKSTVVKPSIISVEQAAA